MRLFKEHQYLLILRESRVVMGRRAVNLWLLVMVMTATFFAIAFSEGSMTYLEAKMNDPFTNWVNIERNTSLETIGRLRQTLDDDSLLAHYQYDGMQTEIKDSRDMLSPKGKAPLFSILYFENLSSDLIAAVLAEDNVVGGISICPDSISETSLGVIMTIDALQRLGYSKDDAPSFVDCQEVAVGADTLGMTLVGGKFVRVPLPLLAVVKRLPMNREMLASKYLYEQFQDRSSEESPFNMNNEAYARKLRFFVPGSFDDFSNEAVQEVPDSLKRRTYVYLAEESVQERLRSWKDGKVWTIDVGEPETPLADIIAVERAILKRHAAKGVTRVYNYLESMKAYRNQEIRSGSDDDVLSVHFTRLDSIRAFENFVKDVSGLQIEMTQVNSKENFNAVSNMATILSLAIMVFSIVCIIFFLMNMLQSYFQKVKHNLGTFKAFGISTNELTGVYLVIIVVIVVGALCISLVLTWITEEALLLFGLMKDNDFSWLILWNKKTAWAVLIILVATVITVVAVMRRLLRKSPGDLIYDRT